jgi:hypothetical protein
MLRAACPAAMRLAPAAPLSLFPSFLLSSTGLFLCFADALAIAQIRFHSTAARHKDLH